jgi:hypothetical protein
VHLSVNIQYCCNDYCLLSKLFLNAASFDDSLIVPLFQPAVSVGNVGQLAIDLIISTLNMSKIGYFYTDCLVPMVGNNPYATTEENATELSINAEGTSLACYFSPTTR